MTDSCFYLLLSFNRNTDIQAIAPYSSNQKGLYESTEPRF